MRTKPFSANMKLVQHQERRSKRAFANSDSNESRDKESGNYIVSDWETREIPKRPSPYENDLYLQPIKLKRMGCLEISFNDIHGMDGLKFSLPIRPIWSFEESKDELEYREQMYFKKWLENIYSICPPDELSYFEHNLEVWRQLWRVCEISSVIIIVIDARHPVLHFPPSLYEFVVEVLKKEMIVTLTKTDLVGKIVTSSWKNYILTQFPNIRIVDCSVYNLNEDCSKRYMSSYGVAELVEILETISERKFEDEWTEFKKKRNIRCRETTGVDEVLQDGDLCTIGVIGHPNAGKSSLINSIFGRKIVSASRTPGHTKHFQTIHLTKHIRLCDCPGLIFPMKIPKWLQIVSGLYNIAQVKDPYEPIMHLSEHIDLNTVLDLKLGDRDAYSVLDICEAFAIRKDFYTAKAARSDIYRAGNFILRAVADGRILLSWKPPGFYELNEEYTDHHSFFSSLSKTQNENLSHLDSESSQTELMLSSDLDEIDIDTLALSFGSFAALLEDSD